MTTTHRDVSTQRHLSRIRSIAKRVRRWLNSLLSGLARSINCYLPWFRGYVILAAVVSLAHSYTRQWRFTSDSWRAVTIAIVALLLAYPVLDKGRAWHRSNPKRLFPRFILVGAACGSLVMLTLSVLPWGDLVQGALNTAGMAWGVAAVLMVAVVVFPGQAFRPEFAELGMFRRLTTLLEIASGLLLFIVAAQQILLWPQQTSSPKPMSPADFAYWIAPPHVPFEPFSEIGLELAATALAISVICLATLVLYLHVAQRGWGRGVASALNRALKLLRRNLAYRITGNGLGVWPQTPRTAARQQTQSYDEGQAVEKFMFWTSFAAISFAFGLWALKALPVDKHMANWTPVITMLVLFLAGGIHVWIGAIEVTGYKGSLCTLGLWVGSLLLYWPTTLVVVVLFVDIIDALQGSLPATLASAQNLFGLWYRSALGAVTLLVAVSQSQRFSREGGLPRVLRIGMATIALLVLCSYGVYVLGRIPDFAPFLPWLIRVGVLSGGIALFYLPRRFAPRSDVSPFGAQLVASSSIALAPLLFSERIVSISWSDQSYADLTVKNVGISPSPLQLRVFVAGSEDEVFFEATSSGHVQFRGKFDFVLTDLRTAIQIMAAYKDKNGKGKSGYKLLTTVATVPWQRIEVTQPNQKHPSSFILDTGHLRYAPPYEEVKDKEHPCFHAPDQCRHASAPVVAHYAANHAGDVGEVFLGEPYATWLHRQRGLGATDTANVKSRRSAIYVLLARYELGARPAVPYNWRRTICEMIAEGQAAGLDNISVINHAQLHIVHRFLEHAITPKLSLQLEDIHLALCRGDFTPGIPGDKKVAHGLIIEELVRGGFLSPEKGERFTKKLKAPEADRAQMLWDALRETDPPALYDGITEDTDEHFFEYFAKPQAGEQPGGEVQEVHSYLHTITVVPLTDQPGELEKLLKQLKRQEGGRPTANLVLLASANLGDSALVYLLNKHGLPGVAEMESVPEGIPLLAPTRADSWIAALEQGKYHPVKIKAFIVPIRHKPGGLLAAIQTLAPTQSQSGINIEEVFAFPITDHSALAVIIVRRHDWQKTLSCLRSGKCQPPIPSCTQFVEKHADGVELCEKLTLKRHRQHVIFKTVITPGDNVKFWCQGLPTWTPTWGAIDDWIAEVRFERVLLKIPTALVWQATAVAWIGRIPYFGHGLRNWLHAYVTGGAGLTAYRAEDRWWINIRPSKATETD